MPCPLQCSLAHRVLAARPMTPPQDPLPQLRHLRQLWHPPDLATCS